MEQLVKVLDKEIKPIAYKGERVLTFRQVDELHGRLPHTAKKAFYSNKDRFIEGEDYVKLPYEEWSHMTAVRNTDCGDTGQRNPMIFLTKFGYLLVTKPFMDNHSWKIQRELARRYFIVEAIKAGRHEMTFSTALVLGDIQKELLSAKPLWAKIKRYKEYHNLSNAEICKLLGREKSTVRMHIRRMEACGLLVPPANLPVLQKCAVHLAQ